MFRSQTDEQLAARWDPKPSIHHHDGCILDGARIPDSRASFADDEFAPRVEYIPSTPIFRQGSMGGAPLRHLRRSPVNPILVAFRVGGGDPAEWFAWLDNPFAMMYTDHSDEQIKHARKVLTRLSALA